MHAVDVAGAIERETGIAGVHHVHIWQIAGGQRIATLHARVAHGAESGVALVAIQRVLRERFGIAHATIQIEQRDCIDTACGD